MISCDVTSFFLLSLSFLVDLRSYYTDISVCTSSSAVGDSVRCELLMSVYLKIRDDETPKRNLPLILSETRILKTPQYLSKVLEKPLLGVSPFLENETFKNKSADIHPVYSHGTEKNFYLGKYSFSVIRDVC